MAPLTTSHPFKALYTLYALALETVRLPFWFLLYLRRSSRPHPEWTYRQALGVRIVKAVLQHLSATQAATTLSLAPGREGPRFTVMPPAAADHYAGPLADSKIRPGPVGATWTPAPPAAAEAATANVVLHFHGGAYVTGTGRDGDAGFAARVLLQRAARFTHVVAPQYRLASRRDRAGRFPAALQDALSAYLHVTRTLAVPAARVTLSGDSAGGNLALALLRYLTEFGPRLGIETPAAALLWSPWVDLASAQDEVRIKRNPNYATDYLNGAFGSWGARCYVGDGSVDARDPYLSPLGNPFKTPTPIWIQTGSAEVLCADNCALAKELEAAGNEVGLVVTQGAPHDVLLVGGILGFKREAREAARLAGEFLGRVRGA